EEYHVDTPMIICRLDGDTVALLVDEVEDVVVLPEDCMVAPPKLHALSDKMIGVCRLEENLVFLLDVDRLIAPVDLEVG
ncbi:MAG: chemotaxis protein CheW, partial [Actinomycetota bacterium]|nr:chemotaxis protein CheW [Actinomycetota bacterium]